MSTPLDALIIEYLQRIGVKVDRLVDDLDGLKRRMTTVAEDLANLNKQFDQLLDFIKENAK